MDYEGAEVIIITIITDLLLNIITLIKHLINYYVDSIGFFVEFSWYLFWCL